MWNLKKTFTKSIMKDDAQKAAIEFYDNGVRIVSEGGVVALSKSDMARIGALFVYLGEQKESRLEEDLKIMSPPKTPIFNEITLEEYHWRFDHAVTE